MHLKSLLVWPKLERSQGNWDSSYSLVFKFLCIFAVPPLGGPMPLTCSHEGFLFQLKAGAENLCNHKHPRMCCKKNIKWTATSNMVVKSAVLELPMLN